MILKPRPFRKPNLGHPRARGFVGYWLMNEGSGNTVADLSGNGNTGTFVGNTSWVAGKFGSCLYFDGTGDGISTATITFTTNILTIAGWVNITGSAAVQILWETSDNFNNADDTLICFFDGTANRLYAGIQSSISGQKYRMEYISLVENTGWHHIAVFYDNSTITGDIKIYVDGDEQATTIATSTKESSGVFAAKSLYIGSRNNGGAGTVLTGSIDGVIIWDREIPASEIASLYRDPFQMFERPSIELWSAATLGGAPGVSISVLAHQHAMMAGAL